MTQDEMLEKLTSNIGDNNIDSCVLSAYLDRAIAKVLNRLYPYDNTKTEVPNRYSELTIELAICLYNQSGAEGQSSHSENGVSRVWRSEVEILSEITPFAGNVL